jgi:6-phosphogluconolactonase
MPREREVRILEDVPAVARAAAQIFIGCAQQAVQERGVFTVALSGGSTPKFLHSLLVDEQAFRQAMPWREAQFFLGDERHVPPDHPDSNFRMAQETLFSKAPVRPDQIHRIKAEDPDAAAAAQGYESELRSFFKLSGSTLPRFDLVLLGMGNDGHTLSLFPGSKALADNGRLVVRNWVGKLYTDRITFTAPLANNAATALFMVAGADKALALKGVLEGPHEPQQLPSQLIQPTSGRLFWLVDAAAGALLATGIRK